MSLKYAMEAYELLDSPSISGEGVKAALIAAGVDSAAIEVKKSRAVKGTQILSKCGSREQKAKKVAEQRPL